MVLDEDLAKLDAGPQPYRSLCMLAQARGTCSVAIWSRPGNLAGNDPQTLPQSIHPFSFEYIFHQRFVLQVLSSFSGAYQNTIWLGTFSTHTDCCSVLHNETNRCSADILHTTTVDCDRVLLSFEPEDLTSLRTH